MKKFTRFAAILALASGFATPALAAPGTYVIDPTHTFARFSYSHFGLSTQLSRFDKTSGTVVLDKAAKTASVDIVIDTTSVDGMIASPSSLPSRSAMAIRSRSS